MKMRAAAPPREDRDGLEANGACASRSSRSRARSGFSWRAFWASAGPGWLAGAAYLAPRALEFDLQSGAYARYGLLYGSLLRAAVACGFQALVARLGARSALGLAQFCRRTYPRGVSLALWAAAVAAIAAFCARQIAGAALALQALVGAPLALGCALTGASALALLAIASDNAGADARFLARRRERAGFQGGKLMALLFIALMVVITVSFLSVFSLSAPSVDGLAAALLHPRLRQEDTMPMFSMLSAAVIPHNVFLHSALVARRVPRSGRSRRVLGRYATLETALALLVVFLVDAAVQLAFASSVFSSQCARLGTDQISAIYGSDVRTACVPVDIARTSGNPIYDARNGNTCVFPRAKVFDGGVAEVVTVQGAPACAMCYLDDRDVSSGLEALDSTPSISAGYCQEIGLADAAGAVGGALGGAAERLWAVGLLAAGTTTAMAGAYAAQLITEGFLLGSRVEGRTWKARAGLTRSLALLPAVAIAIAVVHNRHDGEEERYGPRDKWMALLDTAQSVQMPLALAPLLSFARSWAVGSVELPAATVTATATEWILAAVGALLCALNYGVTYRVLKSFLPQPLPGAGATAVSVCAAGYLALLFYLAVVHPSIEVKRRWRPQTDSADVPVLVKLTNDEVEGDDDEEEEEDEAEEEEGEKEEAEEEREEGAELSSDQDSLLHQEP